MSKKSTGKSQPSKTPATKAATRPFSPNAVLTWVLCGVIAVTTLLIYTKTFSFGFTNWDDPTYVTENPMMNREQLKTNEIFKEPVSLNYHPVTMLTLAMNYKSAGVESAKVYHQWNVFIHVLNTILAFVFILWLSGSVWAAAFTSAVFGLHPMHVESVAWISERKDVVYTFFFLLSCIAYVKFRQNQKWLWYGLTIVFFVLSVLSKAVAVVLPLVLILIDYYVDRKIELRKQFDKIPLLLFSLAMGVAAYRIQSDVAVATAETYSFAERIMIGSYGAAMYLTKFFVPVNLSAFYPYPHLDPHGNYPWYLYASPFVWIIIGALLWWGHRKFKPLAFGILFFLVTVVLVLQFLSVGAAIIADRYTYVPFIGIAFAVAMLLEHFSGYRSSLKIPAIALCGLFVSMLAFGTTSRINVWKDSDSLWTDVIAKYPDDELAYKYLGNYWGREKNDAAKAYPNYMALKRMSSNDSRVYSSMGIVYAMLQKPDSAMWAYTKAIELNPDNDEAYLNRGIGYAMMRQYDKALSDFNETERITGPTAALLQNRATLFSETGQFELAIKDYDALLQLQPDNAKAYYKRGLAKEQTGQRTEALQDVRRAAALGFYVDTAVLK